jgi:hypothetical protein
MNLFLNDYVNYNDSCDGDSDGGGGEDVSNFFSLILDSTVNFPFQ